MPLVFAAAAVTLALTPGRWRNAKIAGAAANNQYRRPTPESFTLRRLAMSTTSSPPPPRTQTDQREVRIYAHSALFYWWPVWICGYIMALWTYFDGHRLAILPPRVSSL